MQKKFQLFLRETCQCIPNGEKKEQDENTILSTCICVPESQVRDPFHLLGATKQNYQNVKKEKGNKRKRSRRHRHRSSTEYKKKNSWGAHINRVVPDSLSSAAFETFVQSSFV